MNDSYKNVLTVLTPFLVSDTCPLCQIRISLLISEVQFLNLERYSALETNKYIYI